MLYVHVVNPLRLVRFRNGPADKASVSKAADALGQRFAKRRIGANNFIAMDHGNFAKMLAHQPWPLAFEGGILARQVGRWVVFFEDDPLVFGFLSLHRGRSGDSTSGLLNSVSRTVAERQIATAGNGEREM